MALSLSFPSKRPARRPPGPKGLPVLGSLLDLGHDVLGFLSGCARRYGDMTGFTLAGAGRPCSSPAVRASSRRCSSSSGEFREHLSFGGTSRRSSGRPFDERGRFLAASASARGARLQRRPPRTLRRGHGALRPGHAARLAAGPVPRPAARGDGPDPEDRREDAVRRRDGRRLAEIHDRFGEVLEEIAVRFHRPFRIPDAVPLPGNLRYRRGVARIDRLVARILDERRRNPGDRGDLLSMLLAARDRQGQPMGARQIPATKP